MRIPAGGRIAAAGLFAATALAISSPAVASYSETVRAAFNTTDGLEPEWGRVAFDLAGDIYGTTAEGGAANAGVVYRVDSDGTIEPLYTFTNGSDGYAPAASIFIDGSGNIFGTSTAGLWKLTNNGDSYSFSLVVPAGGGASFVGVTPDSKGDLYSANGNDIYEVTAKGKYKLLYTLNGTTDGNLVSGDLLRDKNGDLFGVATYGGDYTNCDGGCGTAFELASDGTYSVLCSFPGGKDGAASPVGGPTMDKDGNLYGTTSAGGTTGAGIIYEVPVGGGCNTVYSFGGTTRKPIVDASNPEGALLFYKGTFYGTSAGGGYGIGGTVFSFTPGKKHAETLLYSFCQNGLADGCEPLSGLTVGPDGGLYGTTTEGGDVNSDGPCGVQGCGTVFELQKQ